MSTGNFIHADREANLSYFPLEGETLKTYAERINLMIPEFSGQLQQHVTWWTHRQPAPCPICNTDNLARNLSMMMLDVVSALEQKKLELKCIRPEGTHSADQFEFKIFPRHSRK